MRYPPKPAPGDRVAVLSPAAGLPGVFPLPFEAGLRVLRDDFGLVPVEYPTTRVMGASPSARAADLTAAFADPTIKAVIASIGGDDQITVIPHLDDEVIRANPKPFFGSSDNTNLLAHLWSLGLVGYHGGGVMQHLGRSGGMHPLTEESLRAALFTSGSFRLRESGSFSDVDMDWADPDSFTAPPPATPSEGWVWHRPEQVVEGPSWGGDLEILSWLLAAGRDVRGVEERSDLVLFLETSEELPSATEVFRMLRNMGERGLLARFPAILWGRPKAWSFDRPGDLAERAEYAKQQRAAVLRVLETYAPEAMVVFDVDLGHTDPQLVIPYGGTVRVDGPSRSITVDY
ncbi:S66 peptidase family protein [Nonomuraea longicatena]|uniref:LD-carboxypeptidase n=1 Tax=Nonomuraea longicatena TaxID=83682 RepID=A0ABP4AY88_9ACTN